MTASSQVVYPACLSYFFPSIFSLFYLHVLHSNGAWETSTARAFTVGRCRGLGIIDSVGIVHDLLKVMAGGIGRIERGI